MAVKYRNWPKGTSLRFANAQSTSQGCARCRDGDGEALNVAEGVKGFTYREPWGVVAGIIPGTTRSC